MTTRAGIVALLTLMGTHVHAQYTPSPGAIRWCSGSLPAFGMCLEASTGNLIWEGATADAFEGTLAFADVTADVTITMGLTMTLSSGTPAITLTDTDTGADSTISASNASGGLQIMADANNEVASSYVQIGNDGTYKITLESSGEVGIGTSLPSSLLHLSSTAPVLTLTDTDTGADSTISASNATGSLTIAADANNEVASSTMTLSVDGTQALKVETGAQVSLVNAVSSDADAVVATRSDCGRLILSTGDTDGFVLTLPDDAPSGCIIYAMDATDQDYVISPASGETIQLGSVSCTAGTITCSDQGDSVMLSPVVSGSGGIWVGWGDAGSTGCTCDL